MSVYLHHLWLNKGNYLMYSIEHDEWIFYSRGNIEKKLEGTIKEVLGFEANISVHTWGINLYL